MDFLATPHLWEIYETANRPAGQVARPNVGAAWRRRRIIAMVGGAIALLLMSPKISAKYYPNAGTAYVATPPGYNLNIRSGPGTRFPAVNTVQRGTPLSLTGVYEEGWAQLADGYWVAGNLINSQPLNLSQGAAYTAYIAPPPGFNVNIRSGPGVQYPAVNTLSRGTAITITGRYEHGWAQLIDGSWVAGNLIQVGQPVNVPAPQPTPPIDSESLRIGTRSPAVITLENRLRELNYVTADFVADDYYGTDTAQAIRNFQQVNQLPVDGIAGPQTRNLLYSSAAIPNRTTTTPTPTDSFRVGSNDPDILPLEIRLQELNYLPDSFIPDTFYGTETAEAIRDFQRRNALTVDGVANSRTRNVLYSNSAVGAYIAPNNPQVNPETPADPETPPTDPESPPTDPDIPDLGGFQEVAVNTNDGQEALVFSGPGTEYDLVGFIPSGTTVTITDRTEGNWTQLEDGNWIYTDFLDLEEN